MILNKLTSIPTILRLSLCLLVSAGIHGGATYYDWASKPSTVHDGRSAVVVALVSAADASSFAVLAPLEVPSEHGPVAAKTQVITPRPPAHSSLPVAKPLPVTSTKPGAVRDVAEIVEESAEDVVPADPICVEPRESSPGQREEVVTITGQGAVPSQSGIIDESTQGAEVVQHDDGPAIDSNNAGSTDGSLIEAMPNYRNNPLPEYPYIARQRHWEGVVWLLVDVSAKGLVDDVDLERSCGYRVLDRAASRAVKRWEFTPATRAGLPVDSQVRIPVRFSLEDS